MRANVRFKVGLIAPARPGDCSSCHQPTLRGRRIACITKATCERCDDDASPPEGSRPEKPSRDRASVINVLTLMQPSPVFNRTPPWFHQATVTGAGTPRLQLRSPAICARERCVTSERARFAFTRPWSWNVESKCRTFIIGSNERTSTRGSRNI